MIPHSLSRAAIVSSQQRVHLGLVQIRELFPSKALEWNGTYLVTPGDVFRTSLGNEARHRMHRSKALVPRTYRTSAFLFKMIQKTPQHISREVEHFEAINL